MKLRALCVGVVVATVAGSAIAALSPAKADWGKGPVQVIMTTEESAAWKTLQSDRDADAFIALFWARRDPTPGTPRNEYREDFEAAVKSADAQFAYRRTRGSMTEPGRILLLFGVPPHATRTLARGAGGVSGTDRPRRPSVRNVDVNAVADSPNAVDMKWTYDGEETLRYFGKAHVDLSFRDAYGDGGFKLVLRDIDLPGARQRAIEASIVQPQLTEAPSINSAPPVVAEPPARAASEDGVKSAALEAALGDAKRGRMSDRHAALSYAEFVSPLGDSYVPVQIYIPEAAGVGAQGADTIFGAVEDASGNRVTAFEEPATLTPSKSDFFVGKTLTLPAGRYTAALGLAKDGQPLLVTSGPIEVRGPARDAAGTSSLILSNNIYVASTAEPPRAPFAFGRLKIVPKGDLRFSSVDDLHYFVEINNPGVDSKTNMPRILCQLDLSGGGKTTTAPLDEAQVLSLTGKPGSGHYAVTSLIPLAQLRPALAPGDYVLKMKLVDSISKQSYDLEQSFKITTGPAAATP
jgi:GWxTD domain-containing protein